MAPTPLTSLLSFPSSSSAPLLPPTGTQVLVTDTLACPAAVLLVHFARSALLESTAAPTPVIWLGCDGQGLPHWSSICRKVGLNLQMMMSKGLFTYIDATEVVCQEDEEFSGDSPLKRLYSTLKQQLERVTQLAPPRVSTVANGAHAASSSPKAVVIVDDISSLAWTLPSLPSMHEVNAAARSAGRWAVALRTLCSNHSASLITLQHSRADSLSTQLFARLFRSSSLWIEVKELSSGRARDCTGEIAVHPLEGAEGDVLTPATGNGKAVLFLIGNDGKTHFWARGTQGTA
ncbi:hypothetical protein BCV69DRAFT_112523 [Microstroma glucosiphilum]|uniref:DNA recombination and repair protein Rad51-like C-terminal domain-containing protein n=1 Tax=Pseudomicrostroma glucosiphilum TaxID=1684307 RepID=A0A316UDE5_9BASI|nr:hypothetical protein BCV69DRAFT_112523 [Pseudomicrostroma glucosiphilum]PWN23226.1 hypothetical protein BCV69DRAFT_112523 [Pseudomicrostroma glucosiphilum]